MTDERLDDAARDALALVRLFLEAGPEGDPDPVAYETILRNGQPTDIAGSGARIFAGFLASMQKREVIDSADEILREMQIIWAKDPGT